MPCAQIADARAERGRGSDDAQAPAIVEHSERKSHDIPYVEIVDRQGQRYAAKALDTIGPWQGDRLPAHRIEDPEVAAMCTLVGAGERRP